MTAAATTPKKRSRSKSKRAAPLVSSRNAQKAIKIGGTAVGAYVAGKALWSSLRFVVGTALVVAAAAAAATFVPKSVREELVGNVRDAAQLAADRARTLTA